MRYFSFIKWCLCASVVVLAMSACTKKKVSNDPQDNTTATSGLLNVAADESFAPVISQEIAAFTSQYPNAKIKPVYTSEVHAIDLLLKDSVRVAFATRQLTEGEIQRMKEKQFTPKSVLVAYDGLALIVNPANKDTLISVDDFRNIMMGKVTRWNQLYPSSKLGELTMVFDNTNSSTIRYAMDSICHTRNIATGHLRAMEHNKDVIQYVADNPDAIGVIGANWLGDPTDTTNLSFSKKVRVMSVSRDPRATAANSLKPYQAYIYLKTYPLVRPIYMIYNDPQIALPYSFMGFVANQDIGQRIILKTGLVPANAPGIQLKVNDDDSDE